MTSIPTSPEVRSTLAAQHRRTRRRAALGFAAALISIGTLAGWLLAVAIRVVGQMSSVVTFLATFACAILTIAGVVGAAVLAAHLLPPLIADIRHHLTRKDLP